MEILAFSNSSLNGAAPAADSLSPAAGHDVRRAVALGERPVTVRLPVGVLEAAQRLARLRAVELNRDVTTEDVMANAICTYLIDAGFLQADND